MGSFQYLGQLSDVFHKTLALKQNLSLKLTLTEPFQNIHLVYSWLVITSYIYSDTIKFLKIFHSLKQFYSIILFTQVD